MKGMISELRAGVGRVNDEILAAAGAGVGVGASEGAEVAAEAAERFSEIMVAFQEGSTAKLKRLEVRDWHTPPRERSHLRTAAHMPCACMACAGCCCLFFLSVLEFSNMRVCQFC